MYYKIKYIKYAFKNKKDVYFTKLENRIYR